MAEETHQSSAGGRPIWACFRCGGSAEDEQSLREHQEWCLGDAAANVELLSAVAERDGELTQEALVTTAREWKEGRRRQQ